MKRTFVFALVAGVLAATASIAPAEAGYRHKGHHFGKFHHFKAYGHRHHYGYGYRVYRPVCAKRVWAYHYGHKKRVCVAWY